MTVPAIAAPPTVESVLRSETGQLFVERATAVLPAFALTAENAGAVARICQ
jgi:predicted ATPase